MKRLMNLTLLLVILLTLPFIANAQVEERLTIVSGNNQKGAAGTALANPFTVKYETKPSGGDWGVVSGKTIYFQNLRDQSISGSASLSASSATTDANGEASVTLTLGGRHGPYAVAASTQKESGASTKTVKFSATAFIIRLKIVSGSWQTDTVGKTLANPFVVQLTNEVGDPWSGQTVTFDLFRTPTGSTGASLSATTATTGTNGQASTTLTLGDTPGAYRVFAEFTKPDKTVLWVRFDVKAEARVATKLEKRSVDGQSVASGTQLSTAYIVRVLDQDDVAMNGVSVSFSVSPSSGSVSRSTMTTGSNGQASTVLTVGTDAGTYTVTASVTKADNTKLTATFTATVPQEITTLQKHSGDGQSALVGTQLSTPLTVKVLDQGGAAMSGVSVSFSVSPSGTLTATTISTSTNGLASTALTLGITAGTYTVTASVTKPDNTQETVEFTATAGAAPTATTLEKRSGDGQSAQVGTQLTSAFIVRVLDQNGAALGGVSVSFSVSPSSGSINRTSMITGSNGQASTTLTLGSTTGTYTVTASITKADNTLETVEFTATAEAVPPPPPPERIATTLEFVSGNGQSAQVSTQLSSAFVVQVLDQDGAALGGVSVSFSVSPSGTLSTTTATTGTNGQASTTLTLGSTTGTYTVTASVAGITETVSFTATGEAAPPPPPPERIATTLEKVSGDGQSAQVNTQLSSSFVVRVLDQDDAALSGVSVSFSVSPSGTLSTTTATTGTNGQALTTLTLGNSAGTYTVTASITKADNTQETVEFTATAEAVPPPPPPDKVATTLEKVSGDGQSAQVNTQLSSAFVVRVLDQDDAVLSGVSVSFSVSPSGSLSATTTTTNTQGQASTTLTLGNTAGAYTVTASVLSSNNTQLTVTFTVTATALTEQIPEDTDTTDDGSPPGQTPEDTGTTDDGDSLDDTDTDEQNTDTQPPQTGQDDGQQPESEPNYTIIPFDWEKKGVGKVVLSELMLAHLDKYPQWIELYNTTDQDIDMNGWKIVGRYLDDSNAVNIIESHVISKSFTIKGREAVLIVSFTTPNSRDRISRGLADRAYALGSDNKNLWNYEGLVLELQDAEGNPIDRIGNLNEADTIIWEIPSVVREKRVSLIRRLKSMRTQSYHFTFGIKEFGWFPAEKVDILIEKRNQYYYGRYTDIGAPGYRTEDGEVLPVTLSSFRAQRNNNNQIILRWVTESELDNAGFNILRSQTKDGVFKVVNPKLIQGAGTTGKRNSYTWTDTTAKPNTVYYYRIEDVSHAGVHQTLTTTHLRGVISPKGKMATQWATFKL